MGKVRIRATALVMATLMVCLAMTGCMAQVAEVSINADGSGTVTAQVGFTKEVLDEINETAQAEGGGADMSQVKTFEYNGVTYYGQVESANFDNLGVLNHTLSNVPEGEEYGPMYVRKASDGSFTLALDGSQEDELGNIPTLDEAAAQVAAQNGEEFTEEDYKKLLDSMVVIYKFTFPSKVTQTSGDSKGVTVSGNTVTIDLMQMVQTTSNDNYYLFTTMPDAQKGQPTETLTPTPAPTETSKPNTTTSAKFSDVPANAWYYSAVNKLAEGGLVAGIGNGKFDPEATMTYSQFCQVLARAKGGETGEQNGYWAYKAIYYCMTNSYLYGNGIIKPENYEIPITREVAIAAMYRARADELTEVVNNIEITDIPDYTEIDPGIRSFVLKAYQYGITTGVDGNRTCKPKDKPTRAQVCQLFYNLNWTAPVVGSGT